MSTQTDTNTSTTAFEKLAFAGGQSELSVFDELFSSGVGAVANIGSVGAASSSSDGSVSVGGNGTEAVLSPENCTNGMCIPDADYLEEIWDYIFPSPVEWIFIGLHVVVFFMGLIGNSLVVYAVMRGKNMRSVTNTFIVNLAVADFLLLLICQPSSLLVDATETWYLGNALCKFITYFQVRIFLFFLWGGRNFSSSLVLPTFVSDI